MLNLRDVDGKALEALLDEFGIVLCIEPDNAEITGSYWGAPEAGIVASTIYARRDTPVHSLLHETCHVICMDAARRAKLDRDAGGEDIEEAAVCYLQILLADRLPGVGREKLMQDMDEWGYSFRLGSTRNWFERDADDALDWLVREGVLAGSDISQVRLRA